MAEPRLIARALSRSLIAHPLRSWAGVAAAVLGVAIATAVLSATGSIVSAIDAANGANSLSADLVAQARSASGMDGDIVRRLQDSVPGSTLAPLLLVNTRRADATGDALSVVGTTAAFWDLLDARPSPTTVPTGPGGGRPEIAVGARWAAAHHLRPGDELRLVGPDGPRIWAVGALIRSDRLPNRGAVAVGDLAAVGTAFGRPGAVDSVYVKLRSGQGSGPARQALTAAGGGAVTVGDVAGAGGADRASLASVRGLLVFFAMTGLLTSAVVLFLCWRLLIEDERANIARFRLVGARTRDFATGSGVVLFGAGLLSSVGGVALGLVLARALADFSRELTELTGLAGAPSRPLLLPALGGAFGGAGMMVAAWASSMVSFARTPPIHATRGPQMRARSRTFPLRSMVLGALSCFLAAEAVVHVLPPAAAGLAMLLLLLAGVALGLSAPALVGRTVGAAGGVLRFVTGREMARHSTRTAATVSLFAVAVAMSVSLEGAAGSLRGAIDRSVTAWTRADLFVLPSVPGLSLRDEKFSPAVRDRLRQVPGVAKVGAFTSTLMENGGRRPSLWAWDTHDVQGLVDLDVSRGAKGTRLWDSLAAGSVAVSENYARLTGTDVGSEAAIPTATGERKLPVAAVVKDYTSDSGIVFASLDTYRQLTGDDRLYDLLIRVEPGTSPASVARDVRPLLQGFGGSRIYTRQAIRNHFSGLTGRLLSAFRTFAWVVFLLAALVGAATVAGSMAARERSIGLVRLCGATRRFVGRQLLLEAVLLGGTAWFIGAPVGVLMVSAILRALGTSSHLFPPVRLPWAATLLTLPAAALGAIAAVTIGSQRARHIDPAQAIRSE